MAIPGNRFTFPEGREEDVAERVLWRRQAFEQRGKVMGFAGKSLHFPGGKRAGCGREGALEGVGFRGKGESDGYSGKIAALSRREERRMSARGASGRGGLVGNAGDGVDGKR